MGGGGGGGGVVGEVVVEGEFANCERWGQSCKLELSLNNGFCLMMGLVMMVIKGHTKTGKERMKGNI